MDVDASNNLRLKLNLDNQSASVIKSPNANGTVFIPRFFEYEGIKYKIISISKGAFTKNKIDYLTFPEDSEVEFFDERCFSTSQIKKLQFPGSLKKLHDECFNYILDTTEIVVSPKNKLFSWFNNSFLLGKSQDNSEIFDVLYFIRFGLIDVIVPPQVKILKPNCFMYHQSVKSIVFPNDSNLLRIEKSSLHYSSVEKLVLPSSVEEIDPSNFYATYYLNFFEVSKDNKLYSSNDNKFIYKKSQLSAPVFDILFLASRNIESVTIPSHVKEISKNAFQYCSRLKSLSFEPNSSLEIIDQNAFNSTALENIVIPPSVKEIGKWSFDNVKTLKSVQILGKSIKLNYYCFEGCEHLTSFTIPYATKVDIHDSFFNNVPDEILVEIPQGCQTEGFAFFGSGKKRFKFIEPQKKLDESKTESNSEDKKDKKESNSEEKTVKKEKKESSSEKTKEEKKPKKDKKSKKDSSSKKSKEKIEENSDQIQKKSKPKDLSKERDILIKHIHFLEKHLNQFEKVVPISIDPLKISDEVDYEVDNNSKQEDNTDESKNIFIDQSDEEHHRVISKIGEGATSVAFKIIDDRNSLVMCKKILKSDPNNPNFKELQNIVKEFEVLTKINHPCICKAIAINMSENVSSIYQTEQQNQQQPLLEVGQKEQTTVALFLEFLPYSLKFLSTKNFLNNTLKVKIALEIAFGMSFIHSAGMMHRDLKLENIMLNYSFEAKIIDFGLVSINDPEGTGMSLTKGIGTLAYMSPEMQNEEEYDEKTDVYSYGVVLYALFSGELPKQSMRDKLNNKPLKFPDVSESMSSYCIELIKKCMAFDSQQRPSFDEIIDDMFSHSFEMASEIDIEALTRRYRLLNRLKSSYRKKERNSEIIS